MRKIIHLVRLNYFDSNLKGFLQRLSQRDRHEVHHITSNDQIKSALQSFSPDAKVIIWWHLEAHDRGLGNLPNNLGNVIQFNESNTINSNARAYFITTGAFNDLSTKGKKIEENLIIEINSELIFSAKIFDDLERNEQLLEDYSYPVRLLLSPEFDTIEEDKMILPKENEDWKVQKMLNRLGEKTLRSILGTIWVRKYEKYVVQPIGGGFSGAITMKVTRYENNQPMRPSLLKLSEDGAELNKEYEETLTNYFSDLPQYFIGAYPNGYKEVLGWHGVIFPFIADRPTLRKYLRQHFLEKETTKIIKTVFDKWKPFERNNQERFEKILLPMKTKRFSTSYGDYQYEGLQLIENKKFKVLEVIAKIKDKFLLSDENKYGLTSELLNDLTVSLNKDDGYFKNKPIESLSSMKGTPLAIVHGDFHTANILIDENGEDISFIDFANVPDKPVKHRFLDIGKFSADLEISIFPDEKLLRKPEILPAWMEAHRAWLNGEAFHTEFTEIEALYRLNSTIRDEVLPTKTPNELDAVEAERQFQMVRMHYFLKAISYDYEIREKILFFTRAVIDILEFLTKKTART